MNVEEAADSLGLTEEQKKGLKEIWEATKKPNPKAKGLKTVWAASLDGTTIQFKTPKKGFLDTTAGKAILVGVVAAGVIVLIAGAYYLLKTSGVLEPLGALPPADMTPVID